MAEQDFAQVEASQPEDIHPMKRSKLLLLTMMALAVVAGGFVVGFMVGHEMGVQKATSDDDERLLAEMKQQQQELAKLRAEAQNRPPEVSTTQVGELTFYNELPKQSVDPAPMHMNRGGVIQNELDLSHEDAAQSQLHLKQIIEQELNQKLSEVASNEAVEYYLQVGPFQKQSDAELFIPKLAKSGFTGLIKRVEIPKLGTWYRVYAGPFDSKQASELAQQRVKNSLKITGLIVKGG